MKTTALRWMAVAAAAVAIGACAAESPTAGDNPALHYYQAFLLTPELAQEDSNYLFHNEWHGQSASMWTIPSRALPRRLAAPSGP